MCLILLAHQTHLDYPFVLAANRDEFYDRPTEAADFWASEPHILAGRDLQGGGTWLGLTRRGRFAALTNFRDPASLRADAPSRGELVSRFLSGNENAPSFLTWLKENGTRYNGFSLLFGTKDGLFHYCNRDGGGPLAAGVHGLSNALLDTPWPKVSRGKDALARLLEKAPPLHLDRLFSLLADRSVPPDSELPHTGVGMAWERVLASRFIASPIYGTRSSTVIAIDRQCRVLFEERSFLGSPTPWLTSRFAFTLEDSP